MINYLAPPPTFAHVMAGRRVKLPFFLGLISGLVCCNFVLTWTWIGQEAPSTTPFAVDTDRTSVPVASKEKRQQGLAVHVLISDEEDWRLIPAVHATWGRTTANLAFHGPPISMDDDELLAIVDSLRPGTQLFFRNTTEGDNDAYMALLQDICTQKQQFEWVAIVKPTTYVLVDRLNAFLHYMDGAEPMWLGRSDAGVPSTKCAMCDGMGSVISEAALSRMCLKLQTCRQQTWSGAPENSSQLQLAHFAECLGVCCVKDIPMEHLHLLSQFFYSPGNLLLRQAIQMGALDSNPLVESALMISGLERPEHVMNVHLYFVTMFRSNAAKMAALVRDELLEAGHKMKEVLRGEEERGSANTDPLWLADHHFQPPSRENSVNELVPWESFDLTKKQAHTYSASSPVRPMGQYELKAMMDDIVNLVPTNLTTSGENVSVHRRLDPFRGIDYLVESCASEGALCSMHHVLQGFELPLIRSVEEIPSTLVEVKFVVSSPLLSRAFHRFITSFESSFLVSHSEENVGLLVVVSSTDRETDLEDDSFAVSTILHLYKKKYPHVDFRMVITEGLPSRYEVAHVASKEFGPSELLFMADIHLDVAALFPQRCRMMAKEKERVYTPIAFAPHDPAAFHWTRLELPIVVQFQVSSKDGFWLSRSVDSVCIYNSDLKLILDAATQQAPERWSLVVGIKAHRGLKVFQSVDPGIAYMWHEQCAEKGGTRRQACEELDKTGK